MEKEGAGKEIEKKGKVGSDGKDIEKSGNEKLKRQKR